MGKHCICFFLHLNDAIDDCFYISYFLKILKYDYVVITAVETQIALQVMQLTLNESSLFVIKPISTLNLIERS